jgi:hypothetical protein
LNHLVQYEVGIINCRQKTVKEGTSKKLQENALKRNSMRFAAALVAALASFAAGPKAGSGSRTPAS